MQQVAIGWLALDLTDSAFFVGVVSFMAGLSFIVVAIPAGAIIDRVDRRLVLSAMQLFAAVLALVVAGDVLTGYVEPWHLLFVAFLNGSSQALLNPTQQAITPSLVHRDAMTNAIGLMSVCQNMSRIVGPSLAGLLIGVFDIGFAFGAQAIIMGTAFVLARQISIPARGTRVGTPRGLSGIFTGFKLILGRPDLIFLFLLACVPAILIFPYVQFLTVIARDVLKIGPGGLGLLMACSGAGAVVGSFFVATRTLRRGDGRRQILLSITYGTLVIGIALSRELMLTIAFLAMAGFVASTLMSSNTALIQNRIEDNVRGRIMSTYMITYGFLPLGALPMGVVAGVTSAPFSIAVSAGLSVALTVLIALKTNGWRSV